MGHWDLRSYWADLFWAWNGASRCSTIHTFATAGNRRTVEEPSDDITTSAWDAQNHLVQVELPTSEIVTYTWAPINKANEERLVQRDDGVDVRRYLWDNNNVLRETDDLGAVQTQYTYAAQFYGDLVSQHQDGDSTFHQYDALDSTTGLTDESGVLTDTSRYEAFGKPLAETGPIDTPYRWVGQQGYRHDESTGDYNLRARDYDPQAARFLSQDPLGLDAGDSNFYRYVANSPINRRDASGLGYFDAGPVNQNTGEYPVYYVIEGWGSDRREHVGFRDLKTDEVIRGVFSNGTGFLYKVHYTAVQALLQNPGPTVLDKWRKDEWDAWFQQNDPRFKSPEPKPKIKPPAPPLFPAGGQCPIKPKKNIFDEGGVIPKADKLPCDDEPLKCFPRALTKEERDELISKLDPLRDVFSAVTGFLPILGEFKDGIEALTGKDTITGQDLDRLERTVTAAATFLPFVPGSVARRGFGLLAAFLENMLDLVRRKWRCLGEKARELEKKLKELIDKVRGFGGGNAGGPPNSHNPGSLLPPSVEIDPDKFRYLLGEVASNQHNLDRSLSMAAQFARIGIYFDTDGIKILKEHLEQVVKSTSNVTSRGPRCKDGVTQIFEVRESLLAGPGGFLKIVSVWEILADGTRRFVSLIAKGEGSRYHDLP